MHLTKIVYFSETMPVTREQTNFFRIAWLLGEYATKHLCLLFQKCRRDIRKYNSFQLFLDDHKCSIFHLQFPSKHCCLCQGPNRTKTSSRQILNENQRLTLYETKRQPCGNRGLHVSCVCLYDAKQNISEDIMDISLCSAILLNLFSTVLDPACCQDVKNLRDHRNNHLHVNKLAISETEFEHQWTNISGAILSIAIRVDPSSVNVVQLDIDNIKDEPLDPGLSKSVIDTIKASATVVNKDFIDVSVFEMLYSHDIFAK